jgi:tetratricopeptide (TPR) repeat protein
MSLLSTTASLHRVTSRPLASSVILGVLAGLVATLPAAPARAQVKLGVVSVSTSWIARKAPECAPLYKGQGDGAPVSNVWESAKVPVLSEHCRYLQQAVDAFRDQKYAVSITLADKAEKLTPGFAGPWVVRGSANARWGKSSEAALAFEKAKTIDARALDDAETLDDYGSVLVRLARLDDARRVYRALLPRVSGSQGLCGMKNECDAAGLAYLTAGALALEAGPKSLDEAVAILREARSKSDPAHDIRRIAALALALALDRRGDVDQARELAADIAKTKGVPTEINSEVRARLVAPEEALAMRAIGLETIDDAAAIEAWKAYLAQGGDKRVWATHAKEHLARLEKPASTKKKVP